MTTRTVKISWCPPEGDCSLSETVTLDAGKKSSSPTKFTIDDVKKWPEILIEAEGEPKVVVGDVYAVHYFFRNANGVAIKAGQPEMPAPAGGASARAEVSSEPAPLF
jgi:hypothetical protein